MRASWQGGIALAIVWLIARFVSRLPAAHKVWLWRLAFLKLVAALIWLSPVALPVLPQQSPAVPFDEVIPAIVHTEMAAAMPLPAATPASVRPTLHYRAFL